MASSPTLAGVGFAVGAAALSTFSVVQKAMMGAGPDVLLAPRAYVVPVLFGGIAGATVGWFVARVRASEARYRLLSDFAKELVFWRGPDGALRYVSPSCEPLTGYSQREFLDAPGLLSDIVHPEDRARHSAHVQRAAAHGSADPMQFRIVRKDGEVRWVSHVCAPIRDASGRDLGTRGSHTDVTAQRQLEDRLRRAQRREIMAELAGGIAHDVQNVLTCVLSPAALLRERASDPAASALASEIVQAGERAADLVRRLLSLGRDAPPSALPVALGEVVAAARPLLARAAGERVVLRVEIEDPAVRVVADPARLEQVLLNLVVNARDAMPRGGTVTVTVGRARAPEGEDEVCPRECALLAVRDEGTGIDPALRDRIFEPFLTTKPDGRGTGLGLAIVDRIVRDHEGWVDVESAPGAGATFRIHLPLAAAPAARARASGAAP